MLFKASEKLRIWINQNRKHSLNEMEAVNFKFPESSRGMLVIKSFVLVNPKYFFKFVNSGRKTAIYPTHVSFNGAECSDDIVVSNLFAEYFRRKFSTANSDSTVKYPCRISSTLLIPNLIIPENDGASSLKYNSAPGPDGILSCMPETRSGTLCGTIPTIFNHSLKSRIFLFVLEE
ncbi:uncharacterized protein LOC119642367 [Glossina fuscipes]|uniref:Uncharacterized protein LOC119642367 n=1 Tax=Glossina fuscipes TaxID=7396 RepID=A0A9C5ZMC2_9MUSC|nr:uncharacterized protein LOC119642367 [Glossina fuscipes]